MSGNERTADAPTRHVQKLLFAVISVPPKLSSSPDRTLNAGERASLTCSVIKGDLPMSMAWLKDGRAVDARSVTITQLDQYNSILLIESLSQEHNGNYSCFARNAAAEVSYTTQLFVNVPPIIEPFSFQDGLSEGMRTRTVCGVSQGDPPLTITWLKDGGSLPPHLGANFTTLDAYSSLLSIPSLTSSHSGDYTCVASNPAAELRYTAKLQVKGGPLNPATWSVWRETAMLSSTVKRREFPNPQFCGRKRQVLCRPFTRGGRATVRLTKVLLPTGGKSGEYEEIRERTYTKIFPNGSLLLQNIKEDREGMYMCQATNGIGNPIGRMIQLKVNSPPHFATQSKQVTVKKGDLAVLRCDVSGDKPLTLTWLKSGNIELSPQTNYRHVLDSDVKVSLKQDPSPEGVTGEIRIEAAEPSDSGAYFCQASNAYGREQQMVQLSVQEPPQSPSDLEMVSVSSRSVNLQWKRAPESQAEVNRYIIQYKEEDAVGNWQNVEVGILPSATIEDLKPDTRYTVRVIAEGTAGRSSPTLPIVIKTEPQRPAGPPLHINVRPVSSTEIFLTWSPPLLELRHGKILGYNIGVREASSSTSAFTFTNVSGDGEEGGELLLTGLSKFTRYSIVIRSFNQVGPGPLSEPILTQTLEDVPSLPPEDVRCSALTPQSLQISWQPPAVAHCNGILQGYKVHIESLHDGAWFDADDFEPRKTTSLTIVISGLRKFTNYSIQVLAFTRVGDGTMTRPTYCQTEEDVPGPPEDIKVVVKSPQSLVVSWLPPKEPNGLITKYNLYMRSNNLSSAGQRQNRHYLPTQHTFYEVKNLRQQVEYQFHVTASTRIGEGESSRTVSQFATNRGEFTFYECHAQKPIVTRPIIENQLISVPARIASFGGAVVFPRQSSATLQCNAVGQPEPRREWFRDDQPLRLGAGQDHQILESGEIILTNLKQEDTANYTCQVDNLESSDRIVYNLVVQGSSALSYPRPTTKLSRFSTRKFVTVPPSAPVLYVTSATSSSILFHWKAGSSGGAIVTGFILYFRKGISEPEELLLPRRISSYELKVSMDFSPSLPCSLRSFSFPFQNLSCGSTYHLFLIAHNKIGKSPQSTTLTVRTQGEAPGVPQGTALIQPNSTSVLLRLHVWPDSGCPLLYFVIQYRANTDSLWILGKFFFHGCTPTDSYRLETLTETLPFALVAVSNSLKPQKRFTISSLKPSTVYQLKIEAHNIAGSSMAEFTFITLTKDGDPPPPELVTRNHPSNSFLTDIRIVIPILLATAALFAAVTVAAFCWKNRNFAAFGRHRERSLKKTLDGQQRCDAERERYYATIHKAAFQPNNEKIPETSEDISPYATFQLSQADAQTNAMFHSFMYHEQTFTKGCASPPPPSIKISARRRSRSRSRKRETDSGSDSEVDHLTSSRTEISSQLDGARVKQNYLHHGAHSSTSSDMSPLSEGKSLPRRGRNRYLSIY
ncbi:hypothetical protein RUM44_009547 [Polyplax serrata]|uniref:Down syndrome cell adhesion molecule-like protein Dscam2 n=1 Tax=Polyplax serrata TaxID=468196 RepID=A0ABR1AT16_POLSC